MTDPTVRATTDTLADLLPKLRQWRLSALTLHATDFAREIYDAEKALSAHLFALGEDTNPYMILADCE